MEHSMKIRRIRYYLFYVVVIGIICLFTFRLMRYQITDGASYRSQSGKTTVETTTLSAPRGEILDRYGRVLATNTVGYSVTIEKGAWPTSSAKQNTALLKIVSILQQEGSSWEDTLPISSTEPWSFTDDTSSLKTLRSFVEETLDSLPTSSSTSLTSSQKATKKADEKATAKQIMARLIKRYSIDTKKYSAEQIRTLVGLHYQMDIDGFSYNYNFTIAKNVSLDTVNRISENTSIPGILISEQYSRSYTSDTFAPYLVGTVSSIYADEYNNTSHPSESLKNKGYSMDDIIGRTGVESTMESYLRGTSGTQNVIINKKKQIVGTETSKAAKPGNNVVLTIDSDLQQTVQDELPIIINQVKSASGGSTLNGADADAASAVVLNIKTGEVLAMASYPTYTRTQYATQYSTLAKTKPSPLLNRTIQGAYTPGSTFKPVTATAGLMNGVITATEKIDKPATFSKYSGYVGHDDVGAGYIDVETALSESSNVFFNIVADTMYTRGIISKLESTASSLGLGKKTGIELPGEVSGSVSGPTYAKSIGKTWNPADAAQSGIGQLYNQYTPLQLAQYVGALVNGGTYYKAHIVKEIKSYDNSKTVLDKTTGQTVSDISVPSSVVDTVKEGMLRVTESADGTASSVFSDFPIQLGGKTGTAQINNGANYNAVFVSFAPFSDPQIAIAIVVEKGHNGYQTAPVARSAYNYLFVDNQQWTTDQLPSVTSTLPSSTGSLLQ